MKERQTDRRNERMKEREDQPILSIWSAHNHFTDEVRKEKKRLKKERGQRDTFQPI